MQPIDYLVGFHTQCMITKSIAKLHWTESLSLQFKTMYNLTISFDEGEVNIVEKSPQQYQLSQR